MSVSSYDDDGHPRDFELESKEFDVTVHGTYDTPQRFGVGVGHIAGYRAVVGIDGQVVHTRGYAEYVSAK